MLSPLRLMTASAPSSSAVQSPISGGLPWDCPDTFRQARPPGIARQHDRFVAAGDKSGAQGPPDQSGAAGKEHLHARRPSRRRMCYS